MRMSYVFHLVLISVMIMSQCYGLAQESSSGKRVITLTLEPINMKSSTLPIYYQKYPETYYGLLYDRDEARLNYLDGVETTTTTAIGRSDIVLRPTSPSGELGWAFSVLVTVGTPPSIQPLLLDTGSTLTWIQCNPLCIPVRQGNINYPIHNWVKSETIHPVHCKMPDCDTSFTACGSDQEPWCLFGISYNDGNYAIGKLVYESIDLGGRNITHPVGCSLDNNFEDTFYGGVLGLGRGRLSLAERIFQNYPDLNVFSYCLALNHSTALIFSSDYASTLSSSSAHRSSLTYAEIPYTRMITKPDASIYYYVDLVGISIGLGDIIEGTEESIFRLSGVKGGIYIDSGTTFTHLIPEAYNAVKNAFKEMATGLPGWILSPEVEGLTCYNLSYFRYPDPQPILFDSLFFHFRAARTEDDQDEFFKLELGFDNVMTLMGGQTRNIYCLALKESKFGRSIIGMIAQRHIRIVHDFENERIGFDTNGCFI